MPVDVSAEWERMCPVLLVPVELSWRSAKRTRSVTAADPTMGHPRVDVEASFLGTWSVGINAHKLRGCPLMPRRSETGVHLG